MEVVMDMAIKVHALWEHVSQVAASPPAIHHPLHEPAVPATITNGSPTRVQVSKEKLRPEFPGTTHAAYRSLAEQCWQDDRKLRPTFRQVGRVN